MQNYQKLTIFTIFFVLLISQVPIMTFAHHNDDAGEKKRLELEPKTKVINEENEGKKQEIKDAWKNYKESFNSWKVAKENYKEAVRNGDQVQIDSTKIISDQAFSDMIKAWNEYQEIKKKNK